MGWLSAVVACLAVVAVLAACYFAAYEWWRRAAASVPLLSLEFAALCAVFAGLVTLLTVIALCAVALILLAAEARQRCCEL
ncbi:MAG: hypothetical protein QXT28_06315 [Thermofilaceae archaeon]